MPPKENPISDAQTSDNALNAQSSSQSAPLVPVAPPSFAGSSGVDPLSDRVAKLQELYRNERMAIIVTNPSFEMGRPDLRPSTNMRGDPTNVFNRPSLEFLYKIKPKAISNNMATSEDMAKIFSNVEGLGVPTEQVNGVLLQVAIYCKDASSSIYLDPQGTFTWTNGAVLADAVMAIIKRDAGSLRRFCRVHAPNVWNYMLLHNDPPSDWAAMGFKSTEKFAAFDCFDYVENTAAIQPVEGLIRPPTPAEKIAHNTHKRIALDRANREETFGNLETEITGGRRGPEIVRDFNNANNK